MKRRIVLDDKKIMTEEPKPILPRYRQRYCTTCEKWYRCANDHEAKRHEATAAHQRRWRKKVGLE